MLVPLMTQSELMSCLRKQSSKLSCMRACRALMLLAASSADAGMPQVAGLQAREGRCGYAHGQSLASLRLCGGGGVTAGAARSKHEIMQELQALRQQRDAKRHQVAQQQSRQHELLQRLSLADVAIPVGALAVLVDVQPPATGPLSVGTKTAGSRSGGSVA